MRVLPAGAGLAPLLLTTLLLAPSARAQVDILPLDEVRSGMIGEGRTSLSGNRMETFSAEVVGVLRGALPGRNIILARLSGANLEHTGVMQGMSGSPVHVEGRLMGAVAYAFPFAKDPICGITPFEEMVRFSASPRPESGGGPGVLGFSHDGTPFVEPPPRMHAAVEDGRLQPIRTPVSVSGLPPAAESLLAPLYSGLGMALLPGGRSASGQDDSGQDDNEDPPRLVPGSPVGATLIGGDMVLMANGTVTHVDASSGEVFAFGHPFLSLGNISIPMQEVRVEAEIASLSSSFIMASAGRQVGAWSHDGSTGIRGVLGVRPQMVPMTIRLVTSRGARSEYSLQLANIDSLTPLLAFSGLVSILAAEESQAGPQTLHVNARITLDDGRVLPVEDVLASASGSTIGNAGALVAAPLALLLANPLERIPVRGIEVEVAASAGARTARVTRAWFDSSRVRPGGTASLVVTLRDHQGAERTRTLDIPIPDGAAGSRLRVLLADSATMLASAVTRATGTPERVEQIYRAISRQPRQSRLHVRLMRTDRNALVMGGDYLPSLPPSVRSVIARDSSGAATNTLGASILWEGHIEFDATVTGARRLTLEVDPR